jgi:hypothetical protein
VVRGGRGGVRPSAPPLPPHLGAAQRPPRRRAPGRHGGGRAGPAAHAARDRPADPWYLPREDVRTDLLDPSCTTTPCPYKGAAQYRALRDGAREERDVVWSYPEPMHDAEAVEGLLCFFDERLSLTADDGPQ